MNQNTTSGQNCKVFSIKDSALEALSMVSGQGQYHTARPGAEHARPYGKISFDDIATMVKNPISVPKSEAPWVIFSSTNGPLAREAEFQRQNGLYHALWADLDQVGSLTPAEVAKVLTVLVGAGIHTIVYNTKSATTENQKCRIIIPLADPCQGKEYEICQKVFNDKLEAAGIEPDRASERVTQLCYLPNRGAHYEYCITEGNPL